jgi:ribose 5-phosphate isomerase B
MVIHLATDHAGFAHKELVREWLCAEGWKVVDHGAHTYDPQDDFPDFIMQAAAVVSQQPVESCAIIFGGSGQGEALLANRFAQVRAVVYYGGDESIPTLSRQHNDSNVLSIGARFVDIDTTKRVIWEWLHEPFLTDEKYARRNKKIEAVTKSLHK